MRRTEGAASGKKRGGALLVGLCTALVLVLPLLVAAFPRGDRLVVVTAPGSSAAELMRVVRAAEGRLLTSSRFDWIAVVSGDGTDFGQRLRAAGAWLTLDASLFAGCGTPAT